MKEQRHIVLGITGASGAVYARRFVEMATQLDVHVHVAISALGRRLLHEELSLSRISAETLGGCRTELVTIYNEKDFGAPIASGSFLHAGMLLLPCSSNTLAALAAGITTNLVQRAASVTLKERRRLVLGCREAPLTRIDLTNMLSLTDAGAIVFPLCPGFYLHPRTLEDLVDFVVVRMLDLFGVSCPHAIRWSGPLKEPNTVVVPAASER